MATQACTEVEHGVDARAVAAGLIPVAALVAVDPAGWYPFGPAKFAAVTVAVLAAAATCLWYGVRPVGEPLPRRLMVAWAFLIGWLTLAAALGVDRWYAWIGTPERRLGLFTWALFGAAAWIGTQVGADRRSITVLSRMVVIAALWSSAYGLIEWWWRAPIETSSATERLGGPFGSAAYFGAALCLFVPIAAGIALDGGGPRRWRIAAGIAVAAGAVCLVGTGTRAAWLGLTFGAVVLIVARRPSVRWLALGAGVVAVAALVAVPRLGDVTERSQPWDSRVDEWQVAARVITERPMFGVGPEGYRIVVADGIDADYERTYGREVIPDRAHSAPLDVAAIGGLPAAASYLVLMALAAVAAWRSMRSEPVVAGLSVGVVAYGAQQFLLFPLAELDPTWWVLIGVLATHRPTISPRRAGNRRRGLSAGVAAVAVVVFAAGVVEVAADRAARTALDDDSSAHARRAAQLRPDVLRYHLLEASFGAREQSLAGVDAEIAAVVRASEVSPRDPIVRRSLAIALGHRATVTGATFDVDAAVEAWEDILDDDPHCGVCWYELGATELLDGDLDAAVEAFERAARLGGAAGSDAALALDRLTLGGSG